MNKIEIPYHSGYLLRGIAMLMIIFVHSINEYSDYDSSWCRALMIPEYGCMGSSIFFFMSGYGLFRSMSEKSIDSSYLTSHLLKLLSPFIVAFVITYLVVELWPISITQMTTNDITAIFSLSMPCGIDMWFFKVILADYIVTILLFINKLHAVQAIRIITILHVVFIAICYKSHVPLHWYCSNLAFPLGAIVSITPKTQIQKIMVPTLILSIIFFCLYYLGNVFMLTKVPIVIAGNLALSVLLFFSINYFSLHDKVSWLEYIGKNSLYYYLFDVFVMISIPSQNMHFLLYFTINVITATLFVWIWKRCVQAVTHMKKRTPIS